MRIAPALLFIALALFAAVAPTDAQVPKTLAYQGVLTDTLGRPKPDGVYTLSFRLYTVPGGGSPIWTETKSLSLSHGLFSTALGDQAPLNVPFDAPYWLGIQIGTDPELAPRIPLSSSGYSLHSIRSDTAAFALVAPQQGLVDSARVAGGVPDNTITSAKIVNGTIQRVDVSPLFVAPYADTAEFARFAPQGGFVDSARIAGTVSNGAVTSGKIADGAVTASKIPSGQVVRSLNGVSDLVLLRAVGGATVTSSGDTLTINAGAGGGGTGIQGIQNTNNTIDIISPNGPTATINVKTGGVGTSQLADASVTQAKIAPGVVLPPTGSAGGDLSGAYPNPTVAPGVITSAKLADGAVTQAKIAPGLLISPGGAAGGDLTGTYPNPTINALAIGTTKIADAAVTGVKIATGEVVKSINSLKDNVTLVAGSNVSITPSANTLTISSSAGLALPYAGSASSAQYAMDIRNSGSVGSAAGIYGQNNATGNYGMVGTANEGIFGFSSGSITSAAVRANQFGSGLAFEANSFGGSGAGSFNIKNATNGAPVIYAATIGTGSAAYLLNSNTGGAAAVLLASTTGLGPVAQLSVANASNANTAFAVSTNGTGRCMTTSTSGTGEAAYFENINSLFNGYAVEINAHNGTGLLSASSGSAGYGIVGKGYYGVLGTALVSGGTGVSAVGNQYGVNAFSGAVSNSVGIYGQANGSNSIAIQAYGTNYGFWGQGDNIGLYAHNSSGTPGRDVYLATASLAADMYGDLYVHGNVTKAGGSFKIDHPLDPANKYLYHSFVESPDMKNIYDGIVTLDGSGQATVTLPDWFDVLNRDFRYQLTAIGAPGPNLHISQKVSGNSFAIAGGSPGMEVSWQLTGIRQDAWANAHRIPVEEVKSPAEHGHYDYPELFGQTADKSTHAALHPQTQSMQADQVKTQQAVQERVKGAGK